MPRTAPPADGQTATARTAGQTRPVPAFSAALAVGWALAGAAAAQTAPPLDRYGGGELYGAPQPASAQASSPRPSLPYGLRPRTTAPSSLAGMRTLGWAGKADRGYAPALAYAAGPSAVAYAAPGARPTAAYQPQRAYASTEPQPAKAGAAYQRAVARRPAPQASPPPSSGWVPFDATAYAPARASAPAAAPRWTPPPTPATIYQAPTARLQDAPHAPADPPRTVPPTSVSPRNAALRPAQTEASASLSKGALPRSAWGSMPPPRGYRVAQAEPLQAPRSAPTYAGSGVRHYSVHRDFGMRPDATPIPPQFFTATADLSAETNGAQPPGPDPLARRVSSGRSSGQARAIAATSDTSQ